MTCMAMFGSCALTGTVLLDRIASYEVAARAIFPSWRDLPHAVSGHRTLEANASVSALLSRRSHPTLLAGQSAADECISELAGAYDKPSQTDLQSTKDVN